MIKAFIKDSNTVELHIAGVLDCLGNKTAGKKGFRDKIENLGLTWEKYIPCMKQRFYKGRPIHVDRVEESVEEIEGEIGSQIDLSVLTFV